MKQTGHSDIKTTLAIYTHLDDDQQKNDISALNKLICQSDVSQDKPSDVDT